MNQWHERLDLVGNDVIQMTSKRVAKGLDVDVNPDILNCNACVDAELTMTACNGLLGTGGDEHVIFSDVIGSIEVPSCGSSRYILTMIVEKS